MARTRRSVADNHLVWGMDSLPETSIIYCRWTHTVAECGRPETWMLDGVFSTLEAAHEHIGSFHSPWLSESQYGAWTCRCGRYVVQQGWLDMPGPYGVSCGGKCPGWMGPGRCATQKEQTAA
jgi:hypothetical protein